MIKMFATIIFVKEITAFLIQEYSKVNLLLKLQICSKLCPFVHISSFFNNKVKYYKETFEFLHFLQFKGYLLQSSLVFLMLCSTQNFC